MSFDAVDLALQTECVDSTHQRIVLVILAHHLSPSTGNCYPSIDTIARTACLNRRSVERALSELEAHRCSVHTNRTSDNLVRRINRHKADGSLDSNEYRLNLGVATNSRQGVASDSRRNKKKKKSKTETFNHLKRVRPDCCDESAWVRWFEYKWNGQSIATRTLNLATHNVLALSRAGFDVPGVIDYSIAKAWQQIADPGWNLPDRLKSDPQRWVL